MISQKILPAHILRLYLWDALQANNSPLSLINITLDNGQPGTLIPIIPLEDQPRVQQAGEPYMIYAWAEDSSTEIREVRGGLFVLRIITKSMAELGTIENIVSRLFEGEDDSAINVNLWSTKATIADLVGIRFTSINVQYVEGGMPSDSEGGPVEGTMNIHYKYITQYQPKVYKRIGGSPSTPIYGWA